MKQVLFHQAFPNGLTLLGEPIDHVRSATFYALVPAGFTYEPADRLGLAGLLAEMLPRGAGSRDSKALSMALDNLGVDRGESPGPFNINCSGGTLARHLPNAIELYADILRRPWLPESELEPAQELALQELQSLDDSPADTVLLELKRRYYPAPYNRNQYGTAEGIQSSTTQDVRDFYTHRVRPDGAILAVAGKFDWPALVDQVGRLFGDWVGQAAAPAPPGEHTPEPGHITKETHQTQIALAFPSAAFGTDDFYPARGAIGVLSGGMSSRLFTKVREERGLCYSISASYDSVRDRAAVVCYAGTTAARAQETLDVTVQELRRLQEGISQDEVDRVKATLKTSLIMQQESTSARAASLASDWFHLGRVRSMDEIQAAIDGLTPQSILRYLERYPVRPLTVVTLGPKPLEFPL